MCVCVITSSLYSLCIPLYIKSSLQKDSSQGFGVWLAGPITLTHSERLAACCGILDTVGMATVENGSVWSAASDRKKLRQKCL